MITLFMLAFISIMSQYLINPLFCSYLHNNINGVIHQLTNDVINLVRALWLLILHEPTAVCSLNYQALVVKLNESVLISRTGVWLFLCYKQCKDIFFIFGEDLRCCSENFKKRTILLSSMSLVAMIPHQARQTHDLITLKPEVIHRHIATSTKSW